VVNPFLCLFWIEGPLANLKGQDFPWGREATPGSDLKALGEASKTKRKPQGSWPNVKENELHQGKHYKHQNGVSKKHREKVAGLKSGGSQGLRRASLRIGKEMSLTRLDEFHSGGGVSRALAMKTLKKGRLGRNEKKLKNLTPEKG